MTVELNVNADFHNFDMFNISFIHKMSKYLFHEHNYEGRSHGKNVQCNVYKICTNLEPFS